MIGLFFVFFFSCFLFCRWFRIFLGNASKKTNTKKLIESYISYIRIVIQGLFLLNAAKSPADPVGPTWLLHRPLRRESSTERPWIRPTFGDKYRHQKIWSPKKNSKGANKSPPLFNNKPNGYCKWCQWFARKCPTNVTKSDVSFLRSLPCWTLRGAGEIGCWRFQVPGGGEFSQCMESVWKQTTWRFLGIELIEGYSPEN